ncbi:MAG: lysophospholipid acyltransferase family protein, partial [Desulfatiglandaceae bacterium]
RTGIELDEEDISEVVIVRDLLQTVIRKAAGGETHPSVSPLESPEQVLTAEQMRWVQPTGTVQDGLATFLYSLLRKTAVHMFEFSSRGTENIPTEGPFIITPNHVSYLDAFAVAAALDLERLHRIYWAGFTGAAFKNVFFRYFSRLSRTIPIDPEHGILSGMALAATVLSRRQGLVWFPEGERSPDGRLQPFKSGIGLLLTHYPVPVIPAFVHGTERILPRGRAIPRPGTIHLTFGPRLDPDTLADKGEGEKRMDRITSGLHQEVAHLGKIVAPNPGPEK